MTNIRFCKIHVIFAAFVLAYCAWLVSYSRMGFNLDDIWFWISIIDEVPLKGGYSPQEGRFYPLAFQDLNILSHFTHNPYVYFTLNAILVCIFAYTGLKVLNIANPNKYINVFFIALFMCSSGFVTTFFGFCYPEKYLCVYLAIYVICALCLEKRSSVIALAVGLIALNCAIYLKEPVFVACGGFGLVLLIYAKNKMLKIYGIASMISAVVYAFLYVIFIVDNTEIPYGITPDINTLISAYILNDGMIFIMCVVFAYRIHLIARKKDSIHVIYDGLLVGAFLYFAAFVVLGIYEVYYLLPAYVLSGASMIYYFRTFKLTKNRFFRICLCVAAFVFFASNLPNGIYNAVYLKRFNVQFHNTLAFIKDYVREHGKTTLYFEDIRVDYMHWYIGGFATYLNRIYNTSDFSLNVNEAQVSSMLIIHSSSHITHSSSHIIHPSPPIIHSNMRIAARSAWVSGGLKIDTPKTGDLIILNSTSFTNTSMEKMHDMELLYTSGFAHLPYISIESLLNYIGIAISDADRIPNIVNFFTLPLQTYVFRVP